MVRWFSCYDLTQDRILKRILFRCRMLGTCGRCTRRGHDLTLYFHRFLRPFDEFQGFLEEQNGEFPGFLTENPLKSLCS
jgi:hypothetical protein